MRTKRITDTHLAAPDTPSTRHCASAELERIIRATPWLMQALACVRGLCGDDAYIGAGAIRNTVWDRLHGVSGSALPDDVDVVLFDPDAPDEHGQQIQQALQRAVPTLQWEVVNQAHAHRWQAQRIGRPVAPFSSLQDALVAWPETATAVAVRLTADDALRVVAPWGLEDLFGLTLRASPACRDVLAFQKRLQAKRFVERWPQLRVVDDRR